LVLTQMLALTQMLNIDPKTATPDRHSAIGSFSLLDEMKMKWPRENLAAVVNIE
jgi:hypothetical protein